MLLWFICPVLVLLDVSALQNGHIYVHVCFCNCADTALLHIKSVAANAPMVYSPRSGVAWRFPIAKWAYVHVCFCHCADTALLHIKSVAANAPMVYSPRSGVAYSLPFAKWAHVNISFVHYACVLHAKSVPASAAMIYLTCTHRAQWSLSLSTRPPPIGGSAAPGR